ncbi:hypothetical protein GW17_00061359, partial [Ensete ventricosum]
MRAGRGWRPLLTAFAAKTQQERVERFYAIQSHHTQFKTSLSHENLVSDTIVGKPQREHHMRSENQNKNWLIMHIKSSRKRLGGREENRSQEKAAVVERSWRWEDEMKPRGVEETRLAVVNKLEEVESAPAEEVVARRREEVEVAVVVTESVEAEVSRQEEVERGPVEVVNRPVVAVKRLEMVVVVSRWEEVENGAVVVVNRPV